MLFVIVVILDPPIPKLVKLGFRSNRVSDNRVNYGGAIGLPRVVAVLRLLRPSGLQAVLL
jgi:hypothetical protein